MSRDLADLLPFVARLASAHISLCADEGIKIIITCGYRSPEEQAALYALGRTAPGRIRTNAKPGKSWHQYRSAYDVVPIVAGKADWDDWGTWNRIGELGESLGLEWAGRWRYFREAPHFQATAGMTISQVAALKPYEMMARLEEWYERTGLIKTLGIAEGKA